MISGTRVAFPWCVALLLLPGCSAKPAAPQASPPEAAPAQTSAAPAPAPQGQLAGYIFDAPVPIANYDFAKRVSHMFPHPWEEGLSEAKREEAIWEALILHYESFRRGVAVSEEELERRINSVLKGDEQSITRSGDREAYARWVADRLKEDTALFENQMRYLLQIDKLKEDVRRSSSVSVSEEELQREFLNEQHHVGGEMVTFRTSADAEAFYQRVNDPAAWDAMKASGERQVRPVSLMTLEAYMDLWSIPKEQIYAFHAMPLGSIGPPMPFGRQWCVYRLLDKREGKLEEFPSHRAAYEEQVRTKKQYDALKRWIDDLKASARLKLVPLSAPPAQ